MLHKSVRFLCWPGDTFTAEMLNLATGSYGYLAASGGLGRNTTGDDHRLFSRMYVKHQYVPIYSHRLNVFLFWAELKTFEGNLYYYLISAIFQVLNLSPKNHPPQGIEKYLNIHGPTYRFTHDQLRRALRRRTCHFGLDALQSGLKISPSWWCSPHPGKDVRARSRREAAGMGSAVRAIGLEKFDLSRTWQGSGSLCWRGETRYHSLPTVTRGFSMAKRLYGVSGVNSCTPTTALSSQASRRSAIDCWTWELQGFCRGQGRAGVQTIAGYIPPFRRQSPNHRGVAQCRMGRSKPWDQPTRGPQVRPRRQTGDCFCRAFKLGKRSPTFSCKLWKKS